MKRCKDCKFYKYTLNRGPYCENKNRKERIWTSVKACSDYIRKWYKFGREK